MGKEEAKQPIFSEPSKFETLNPQEYITSKVELDNIVNLPTYESTAIMENADKLEPQKVKEQITRDTVEIGKVHQSVHAHEFQVIDSVDILPDSIKPEEIYATSSIVESKKLKASKL